MSTMESEILPSTGFWGISGCRAQQFHSHMYFPVPILGKTPKLPTLKIQQQLCGMVPESHEKGPTPPCSCSSLHLLHNGP